MDHPSRAGVSGLSQRRGIAEIARTAGTGSRHDDLPSIGRSVTVFLPSTPGETTGGRNACVGFATPRHSARPGFVHVQQRDIP
ncbi:hypothetical protein KCP74_13735 [Salmonella enterica subsp. enterica]|nr:hypothetical protein KCP74_13735 [Salmonella enterica subsp. enterica]